jgi:predicted dehydrogenase
LSTDLTSTHRESGKQGVAVFGAGAFGRNHLRVYRELEQGGSPVRLAAIVDADPAAAERLRADWQVPVFLSAEECLAARRAGAVAFDAASVCVPTSAHYSVAASCLEHGVDLLIEKPLAATLEQADALVRQASEAGRIVQAGHLERFNPAVTAVEPLLNGPMFFEAHRLSVFTPRALDVDVVLDLMIHDLDIVLTFARSPLLEVRAVGLPILSPKIDIANVRLEFVSGAVANFTASRVSTEKVRKLRFFQPHQYVSIDYARRDLLLIDVAERAAEGLAEPSPGLAFRKPPVGDGEPLRLEIEAFLDSVRTRTPPRVTAQEGRDALALALEINREILAHMKRAGLKPGVRDQG